MRNITLALIFVVLHPFCQAEEALNLPSGADFTQLRMDYAAQPDFCPQWKVDDQREAIVEAYKAKDNKKVVELSKSWIEKVPVDADIHFMRAQALKKVGDLEGFSYHWYCFYGLIHSIASSGDGKTPETAFKVISVSEEYYLLNEIGAEVIEQSLDYPCDVMKVLLRDGTEATFYFNVSIPMKATSRQLNPEK